MAVFAPWRSPTPSRKSCPSVLGSPPELLCSQPPALALSCPSEALLLPTSSFSSNPCNEFLKISVTSFLISKRLFVFWVFLVALTLFMFHRRDVISSVRVLMTHIFSSPLPLSPRSGFCFRVDFFCLLALVSVFHVSGFPLVELGCLLIFECGLQSRAGKVQDTQKWSRSNHSTCSGSQDALETWLVPGTAASLRNKNTGPLVQLEFRISNK